MREFRLRGATPSARAQTLTEARLPGSQGRVDIELRGARVSDIRPAGARPPHGEVVGLDGMIVVPGLWDHHVHFTTWAVARHRIDLSNTTSPRQAAAETAARAGRERTRSLIVGVGFRDAMWVERPSLEMLDRAVPNVPTVLISADLHAVWLNSAARHELNIADRLTAVLTEESAFHVQRILEDLPEAQTDAWAADAMRDAASRGVVGISDFEMAWNRETWQRRAERAAPDLRVCFGTYPQDLEHLLDLGHYTGEVLPHTHGLIEVGAVKMITDGSLNARTAYCDEPYGAPSGHAENGTLNIGPDDLRALMERAHRNGVESAVHAIGDRANAYAIDAFEATGAQGSIEHAQLLRVADIPRLSRLGITASVQPEHLVDDRDVADRYWADRRSRAFVFRDLQEQGVRLAFGSDAPVAPLDPWAAIASAVVRSRDSQPSWHPEQALSVEEALRASTWSHRTRPIVGDRADLAILETDPLECEPFRLRGVRTAGTLLNGRWTFTNGTL